jgi:heptosyltransferase-3
MLRRNVLIFHQAAFGDFVLTWPMAVALGRLHPQSRIIYVTTTSKGKLAERVLGIDSLDAETDWPKLFAEDCVVPESVQRTLDRTYAIYEFVAGPDTAWTRNMARGAPGVDVVSLPNRPPADWQSHATEYLLQSLAIRPAVRSAVEQILRSVHQRGIIPRREQGSGIVIHPGSGSQAKNWPVANYVALAKLARAAGREVRFVVGEAEREKWDQYDIRRLRDVGSVIEPPTYLNLHAAIGAADVFVGNDSGPTHLAAMCGVPTVAVFCRDNANTWAPIGPKVAVVSAAGDMPTVENVWSAVNKLR